MTLFRQVMDLSMTGRELYNDPNQHGGIFYGQPLKLGHPCAGMGFLYIIGV